MPSRSQMRLPVSVSGASTLFGTPFGWCCRSGQVVSGAGYDIDGFEREEPVWSVAITLWLMELEYRKLLATSTS